LKNHRGHFCKRCGGEVQELPPKPRSPQSNLAFLGGVVATMIVVAALSMFTEWLAWAIVLGIVLASVWLKRRDRRFKCVRCGLDLPLDMVASRKVSNAV
jgi:Flp pilus assembly protein TadB